jgi:hypothetical protein
MILEPPPGVSRVTLGPQHLPELFVASKTPSIITTFNLLSGMLTVADKSADFEQQLF